MAWWWHAPNAAVAPAAQDTALFAAELLLLALQGELAAALAACVPGALRVAPPAVGLSPHLARLLAAAPMGSPLPPGSDEHSSLAAAPLHELRLVLRLG